MATTFQFIGDLTAITDTEERRIRDWVQSGRGDSHPEGRENAKFLKVANSKFKMHREVSVIYFEKY